MSLKEHAAGYSALAGYTGLTQIFGVNFFQLAPDYRAWWLVGAVCVLGILTSSPASRFARSKLEGRGFLRR